MIVIKVLINVRVECSANDAGGSSECEVASSYVHGQSAYRCILVSIAIPETRLWIRVQSLQNININLRINFALHAHSLLTGNPEKSEYFFVGLKVGGAFIQLSEKYTCSLHAHIHSASNYLQCT